MATNESPIPGDPPLRTGWGWIVAYGVLVILIGVLALTNPIATGLATGIILALVLIVYGVAAIASAISSLSRRGRWIELILGILALLAGASILFAPLLGALSLVWAIGFWLVVSGVMQLVTAARFPVDRWWRLFLGLLDLVLGAILLLSGPVPSLAFLAIIVGISFLFRGLFLVLLGLGLRKVSTSTAA
ncbi:HdeD family acid-resistance protein [Sphingobium lignivorans]|uniref:Uncharacterized membrane protein HdeD (DUF308 family) n=1 Tax=Sphingobium lignivorans TaxID=2735886 RepID=A0ABR6NA30_9SPHN|nr:DUF308 domain-containing protein [Sphingobium lignivorans]MBB5984122.1 uncharacterized membrane protein HdeD (DUF308 family) [Sphingobium lignivorans]